MPNWDDARIEAEAAKVVQGWALNDRNDPHEREALEGRISALVRRVRDETREADAALCDEHAAHHRSEAAYKERAGRYDEEMILRHFADGANGCANAIREQKG